LRNIIVSHSQSQKVSQTLKTEDGCAAICFFGFFISVRLLISTHRTHPIGYEFETPIELYGIFPHFSSDSIFVVVDPTCGPGFKPTLLLAKEQAMVDALMNKVLSQTDYLSSTPSQSKVNWAPKGDDYLHDHCNRRSQVETLSCAKTRSKFCKLPKYSLAVWFIKKPRLWPSLNVCSDNATFDSVGEPRLWTNEHSSWQMNN